MKNIAAIILAAGKGERMKSKLPKVLHPICGRPMIGYVLDLVRELKIKEIVAVLGFKHEEVKKIIDIDVKIALQKKVIGTADAVKEAMPLLKGTSGTVIVLYGDTPLLKKATIEKLLKHHIDSKADATLLTARIEEPADYGRIIRDRYTSICGIVEEKDADDFQKDIKEINTGIVCFNKNSLKAVLKKIKADNRKKEYYLTDAISLIYASSGLIESVDIKDINESLGINSRVELAKANKIMQQRINESYMKKGIGIIDPDSTFIHYGTKIGEDSVIYPFTVIEKNVKIGKRCSLGPFIRLREDTVFEDDVTAGNFLEISRSKLGKNTFAKHFCYIGDSSIGKSVNIGAGTVTANFDGKIKHNTSIGDNAFIGSDTILIAPLKIGKSAKTGAGSVVPKNKDVPAGATVIGMPARIVGKK